jgi:spore germination protein YaaH
VRPDGSLHEEPNLEAIAKTREHKIKILPLINVVPSQDAILLDKRARDNAIANIVRVVRANKYDGVNIDFEFIPTTGNKDFSLDRNQMTLFMQLLSTQLKKMKRETHMSVLPHVNVPVEMAGVYDYSALARFVDKVTIMCYDYRQEGSPPGPIAPFSWVEQNIITSIKQGFKPSQICLGVATYGYDWPLGRSGGFSKPSSEILHDAAVKGYQVKWSERYEEPYYVYKDAYGTEREIWFENYATLQTKINLVKKYKISGICIWRLGFEDPKFWQTLEKNWGTR